MSRELGKSERGEVSIGQSKFQRWRVRKVPRSIGATRRFRGLLRSDAALAELPISRGSPFPMLPDHRPKLLSLESKTGGRSPEVSSTAFNAQPLDLHSVPLMDVGFAAIGQLARTLPASYPVLVHQLASLLRASFRPHLTVRPLRFAIISPPSGCEEDLHLLAVDHARHTKKTRRDFHHAASSFVFSFAFLSSLFEVTGRTNAETSASPVLQRVRLDAAAGSPADDHARATAHAHSNGRRQRVRCRCHSPTRAAAAAPDYR
jgi:hypothetical protein